MVRVFKILSLWFLFSCNSEKKHFVSHPPTSSATHRTTALDFDTLPNGQRLLDNKDSSLYIHYKEVVGSDTLKGGYVTCYGVDDSLNYFYLRRGDTLHLLNKREKIVGASSLGILEKDFDSFFITAIDNGNGVPSTYQIFDKETADNFLGKNVEALGYQHLGKTLFLLYDNHAVRLIDNYRIERKYADSVFLYNVMSKQKKGFKLPEYIPKGSYIELRKLTKNRLTISFREALSNEEKLVNYGR